MQYVHNVKSQIVNTSFVIITLVTARYPDPEPIKRACRLIMSRQNHDGSFPQESIEGIFNSAFHSLCSRDGADARAGLKQRTQRSAIRISNIRSVSRRWALRTSICRRTLGNRSMSCYGTCVERRLHRQIPVRSTENCTRRGSSSFRFVQHVFASKLWQSSSRSALAATSSACSVRLSR